jgi:hypothetical protein
VTAGGFSAPRWLVVVLPSSSPAEVRGQAESPSSSDALQPEERTCVVAEWRGGVQLELASNNGESGREVTGANYL